MEEQLFWADQIANEIITRKKFHYTAQKIPELDSFTVKTSASLSGVLHIGRLSDTIRGVTVYKALLEKGVDAQIIWVAEDMDPLRKVPKGVPENYSEYLGMAVTDIPDPDGCHDSYAQHHAAEYFKVIDEFAEVDMKKFSMREEYKKGVFDDYIKKIIEQKETIRKIQDKFRREPLPEHWSPYTPICENCGKIVTPQVIKVEDGKIHYVCKDYKFEKTVAKGCGHEGETVPEKGNGKLMWKSEWAMQWAHWKVVSEGAGKEYQVPNSAYWINGEIAEKVLNFPMPAPIFYEHLFIDNQKMSASLGNVVYPKDWLEVAAPELLKLFYNKRLMKTRSFSWKDLPRLYDELDKHALISQGKLSLNNEKEEVHMKRLYALSAGKDYLVPPVSFSHAAMISQLFFENAGIEKSLKKTGHWDDHFKDEIFRRIGKARVWLDKYAPDEMKFAFNAEPDFSVLDDKQKNALKDLKKILKQKEWSEKELNNEFYSVAERAGMEPRELYKTMYNLFFNRERGPRLASFILAYSSEKFIGILEKLD